MERYRLQYEGYEWADIKFTQLFCHNRSLNIGKDVRQIEHDHRRKKLQFQVLKIVLWNAETMIAGDKGAVTGRGGGLDHSNFLLTSQLWI